MQNVESVRNAVAVMRPPVSHRAIDCGGAASTLAWHDVADERLGFHDAHVRLLGDRQQVVDDIAGDQAAIAPVVRQADLVDRPAVDRKRRACADVTSARASMTAARRVMIVTQSPCSSPISPASSGEISQKSSGCSSARCDSCRDMPPAV